MWIQAKLAKDEDAVPLEFEYVSVRPGGVAGTGEAMPEGLSYREQVHRLVDMVFDADPRMDTGHFYRIEIV